MLKKLYKKILRKINLSADNLKELKKHLVIGMVPENGQFIDKHFRKCPNTRPIAILLKKEDITGKKVKRQLKSLNIKNWEMWLFYILYDIPGMLSPKLLQKRLVKLQQTIDELVKGE